MEMQAFQKLYFISVCISLICSTYLYLWALFWIPEHFKEHFKTTSEEMMVDEVMLSLSWAPSNPKLTSFNYSTSAQHSVVRLEQPRDQYCVGDTLNVSVEMRNFEGQPKAYGGDFMFARILSPKLNASASGEVTDFFNGSYRVQFRLFWPGEVRVSVRLIHSSEAAMVLRRDWLQYYWKCMHMGTFILGRKTEVSLCALRLTSNRPLCEYRKKEDGDYFACYQPKTLPCNSLHFTKSFNHPGPNLTEEDTQLLSRKNSGFEIKNSFDSVTVAACPGAVQKPTKKCAAGMNPPFPGGYFYSNRWSPSYCQTGSFLKANAIVKCLKHKTLYLLGDSTVREWLRYLKTQLKGLETLEGSRFDFFLAVDARNNITVRWIKHFHPWLSSFASKVKGAVPITEVLNSIAGGKENDTIVVIGVGQHFRPYPPEVFIRRIQSIRRAILKLQAHKPQAVVIIKLDNTNDLGPDMLNDSNWYGYMQYLALKKVFEGTKVGIVDAWDMTVAANTLTTHPDFGIVANEVSMALSFSCDYV